MMIELTQQQLDELGGSPTNPPRVVNPQTKESFVLLHEDEYQRMLAEYDDTPWTREELQAVAWNAIRAGDDAND
jgi:hypothetical protein